MAKVQPKIYFTAIGGGKLVEKIFVKMPQGSTAYIYGLLGGEPFTFINWIFHQKTATGFWLGPWLATLSLDETKKWFGTVISDLGAEGKIFGSQV